MLKLIVRNLLIHLRREEEGQTLVEYALLLSLIAIVVIAALLILGPIVSGIFQEIGETL
jgi:pilus assembly protein Flp/PilA